MVKRALNVLAVTASALMFASVIAAVPASATSFTPSTSCGTTNPLSTHAVVVMHGIQWARRIAPEKPLGCHSLTAMVASVSPSAAPYANTPPMVNGGGLVMNATGASAVTVTPIYWGPSGSFPLAYQNLTQRFITDVAHDSHAATNVFSVLPQYLSPSNPSSGYNIQAGSAIFDTNSYPVSGCTPDAGVIYADNTSNSRCLTDSQIRAELAGVLLGHSLSSDLQHLYLIFLPEQVETCLTSANGQQSGGQCSISPVGGFCGYHWSVGTGASATVYSVLPFAIENSPSGSTCGSQGGRFADGSGVGNQAPNGNIDADTEISVMSHEISEALTDPFGTAWQDSTPPQQGGPSEVGDDCAYVYGDSLSFGGYAGAEYNQTINGDHYFIQEEFSNSDFALNHSYACAQNSQQGVVFDPNGGTGVVAAEFATSPTALPQNSFTRAGYTFTGWNTAASGAGNVYSGGGSFPFSYSTTLYAQWSPLGGVPTNAPTSTVTFNANGGSGVMSVESSSTPAALSANTFIRAGYTFTGWNTAASGSGSAFNDGAIFPFSYSTTLYAQWSPLVASVPTNAPGTVTFHANGGSGVMSVESSSTLTALSANTFTRAGYTFTGWNTAPNASGTPYANAQVVAFNAPLTLYAQWSPNLPGAPSRVSVSPHTTSALVAWWAPTSQSPVSGYLIFEGRSRGEELPTPVNGATALTTTSLRVKNLLPGRTYYFFVESVNATGTSSRSAEVAVSIPRLVTSTTLSVSRASIPSQHLTALTFVVQVRARGSNTVPRGTYRVMVGSKVLCAAILTSRGNGTCHAAESVLMTGRHAATAVFVATPSAQGSSSTPRIFTVTK
jgi:uncharacterized repeat protein (TIGR02543 family)